MPRKTNAYFVAEVRFSSRAVFHDMDGRIVESLVEATGLNDWVIQQGAQVIIHDGGPDGAVTKSTEQVIVTQFSFAYLAVNPGSINEFVNRFKEISDKVSSLFPGRLDYKRVGVRSVRFIPARVSFTELVRDFRSQYSRPDLSTLFTDATVADIGFSVDYKVGLADLHTACGPMKKEQALARFFAGIGESPRFNRPWAEVGVFLDSDYILAEQVPSKLNDIRTIVKNALEKQGEAAERIELQFCREAVAA